MIKKHIVAFWVILIILSSCSELLTIKDIENKSVVDGFYDSNKRVEQSVIGIYINMRRALILNRAWLAYGEQRSGDIQLNSSYQDYIISQELDANNIYLDQISNWEYFYDAIAQADRTLEIVEGLESGILNEYEKNLFKGESLALKSLAYFYLARIWGEVPVLESGYTVSKSSSEEVINLAISFAEEAYDLVPWELLNDDGVVSSSLTESRLNKSALSMLLAQEYLWQGSSNKAYSILQYVGSSDDSAFYQFGFVLGEDYDVDLPDELFDSDIVSVSLEALNRLYPEGDTRLDRFYIQEDQAELTTDLYDVTSLYNEDELKLLITEAAWRTGKNEEAKTLLADVADGATEDYLSIADSEIGASILQERARILIGCGYRFFDLIRFNEVSNTISTLTDSDVNEGAIYWPLSNASMQSNDGIIQNSYWLNN